MHHFKRFSLQINGVRLFPISSIPLAGGTFPKCLLKRIRHKGSEVPAARRSRGMERAFWENQLSYGVSQDAYSFIAQTR